MTSKTTTELDEDEQSRAVARRRLIASRSECVLLSGRPDDWPHTLDLGRASYLGRARHAS